MRYKTTIHKVNARKKKKQQVKRERKILPSKTVFDLSNDAEISVFTNN